MPKRVTSPTARTATGRAGTGAPGAGRGSTDAGGVIAPLSSALPPLAEDPAVPAPSSVPGAEPAPPVAAAGDGAATVDERTVANGAGTVAEERTVANGAGTVDERTVANGAGTVAEERTVAAADDVATAHAEDQPAGDDAGAVAPAGAVATGGDAGQGRASRGRTALRRPRTWVAAATAAAVVALGAWGGVVLAGDNAVDSARTAVLAVAAHDITVLSTYDYRHLAHDNALARQIMTPAEWRAYAKPADSVRATIVKDKAVATAKVQAVGIVRATAGRVVVLAAVQQTINDNLLSGPATLPRSYEFTFVPVDGHWRVDYVEQL